MSKEKRGLGRGLATLIDVDMDRETAGLDARMVPIHRIRPNPDQPRTLFDDDRMKELAESIKVKGVLQPLVVRPEPNGSEMFQIIAGERRWRAAQQAMLDTLPVIVRSMSDSEAMESALIENIQRDSLNTIEEATACRTLLEKSDLTQRELAERIGKSRTHVANMVRLLNLPASVLDLVREDKLSAGHARALLGVDNPLDVARRAIALGLTVRQVETLAANASKPTPKQQRSTVSADTRILQANLSANLLTKVRIQENAPSGSGRIVITYRTLDEFDRLCKLLLDS